MSVARQSIMNAVNTFLTAGSPALTADKIQLPNERIDPQGETLNVKVDIQVSEILPATLGGVNGLDRETGTISLRFSVPAGTGEAEINSWFSKFRSNFIHGKAFTYSGETFVVNGTGVGESIIDENFLKKSLVIYYYSYDVRSSIT